MDQSQKDIESLLKLKNDAMDNPALFIKTLEQKRAPRMQKIYKIPEIDIIKLASKLPRRESSEGERKMEGLLEYLRYLQKKRSTLLNSRDDLNSDETFSVSQIRQNLHKSATIEYESTPKPVQKRQSANYQSWPNGSGHLLMKKSQEKKPSLPWTEEEQKTLERLLEEFPEQESQRERFIKISQAMGTRTPAQVASRVQKYFARLTKMKKRHPGSIRSQNQSNISISSLSNLDFETSSSEEDFDMIDNPEYQEYLALRKRFKTREKNIKDEESRFMVHNGYRCDSCNMEPIVGILWRCSQCPEDQEVDLCNQCSKGDFETDLHTKNHILIKVDVSDEDYASFGSEFKYLDPNYNPQ